MLSEESLRNSCPLEKIIIGPKVEQKETLREYLLNHLAKANMDVNLQ